MKSQKFVLFCFLFYRTGKKSFAGKKSFVINAADANLFLVIAKTQTSDRKGDMKNTLSVFIVDGSLPGIEIHEKDKTIGCPSLYQAAVSFKDVILSNGNIEKKKCNDKDRFQCIYKCLG